MMYWELETDFSPNSIVYHRIMQYWSPLCSWLQGQQHGLQQRTCLFWSENGWCSILNGVFMMWKCHAGFGWVTHRSHRSEVPYLVAQCNVPGQWGVCPHWFSHLCSPVQQHCSTLIFASPTCCNQSKGGSWFFPGAWSPMLCIRVGTMLPLLPWGPMWPLFLCLNPRRPC